MEQTNKDKLKFKIARGINALSNETIEFRKEAIIELFRVFENDKITEDSCHAALENHNDAAHLLSSVFHWDADIKGYSYWSNINNDLLDQQRFQS